MRRRTTPESAGGAKKVLVVDDEAPVARLIREVLEGEGFTVITAANGAQGLALAASQKPDVVVLDLHMPTMDGLEALKTLRDDPRARSLPVIILTDREDFGSALEGWNSGAHSCLRKPLQMESLVAEVKRLAK